MFTNAKYKNSKDMRQEIEELVNKTMLSKKRKDELIESLLILYNVRLSLPTERDICKRAKIIKTELDDDNQDFCQASYLMGALDAKNGDIPRNEA